MAGMKWMSSIVPAVAAGVLIASGGAASAASAAAESGDKQVSTARTTHGIILASVQTPSGATLTLETAFDRYWGALEPAKAGDSVWWETSYGGGAQGKVTAGTDTAVLFSNESVFFVFGSKRACAQTSGTVTCTPYVS